MELSKQIQRYRKKHKLSQEDLAEKIYVTRHTISNWERKKNRTDSNLLSSLSQIVNKTQAQSGKRDAAGVDAELTAVPLQYASPTAGFWSTAAALPEGPA
ncbi:hypothetical protein CEK63_20775, partial [Xanthomonas sontii]|uniref:helix-turn-helix transcriptional regulator n=1 Tax=Xanthomonas sontii TaxID=2650745 RepID=UPI0011E47285